MAARNAMNMQGLLRAEAIAARSVAHSTRRMHTSRPVQGPWDGPLPSSTNRYIVIAEDFANAGALARRLEVRDQHMSDVRKGVEVGRIELAGGLLKRDFNDIDEHSPVVYSLAGSMFVVQARSAEEVRQRIMQDEYTQAQAWDPSSLKIYPFLPAFLNPTNKPKSVSEQAETIAKRTPRGVSSSRAKIIQRNEVYVTDPRGTGAALNKEDRAQVGRSLSDLRKGFSSQPRKTTLDNLRKNAVPPVYDNGSADNNRAM